MDAKSEPDPATELIGLSSSISFVGGVEGLSIKFAPIIKARKIMRAGHLVTFIGST
jgi:hypothetical protein